MVSEKSDRNFTNENGIGRRTFIKGAGLATLATAGATLGGAAGILPGEFAEAQQAVPNSAGTERPKLKAPPHSCDCHQHIYDAARFPPMQAGIEPNSTVADYRLLQKRIGTTRNIVTTPRPYMTDNRVTLDAISQFGANSRGIAVVTPSVTDEELKALDRGGIRGLRFSLSGNPATAAAVTAEMVEPLSKRIDAMGWHVKISAAADVIVAHEEIWNRLPSRIVFDHMGRIPPPAGANHPAFAILRRLIDKGRTWVLLSVGFDNSKEGTAAYPYLVEVGQAYVKASPERVIWGSNWPHPNETAKPDDAVLFDLLSQWAPDKATLHRILVENPEELYGFPKA
jgi:predicted TIM-barrel fold metal-dependent hydrolase